jgi:hypothetical protein
VFRREEPAAKRNSGRVGIASSTAGGERLVPLNSSGNWSRHTFARHRRDSLARCQRSSWRSKVLAAALRSFAGCEDFAVSAACDGCIARTFYNEKEQSTGSNGTDVEE